MGVMEGHTLLEGWEEFKGKFWEFYKVSNTRKGRTTCLSAVCVCMYCVFS